jgi:class 3 adenylate cyclase
MPTIVFCDLVGSTGLFEKLGDATASHLVTQLNSALGRAITQFEGRVVKTLGDGIFAVFPKEEQAVNACCEIQRELMERPLMMFADEKLAVSSGTFRSLRIELQIGMESGEVVEINGDCYGDAVNSAARLADLAGARQILTSQRVYDALPGSRHSELSSLGPMFLRGKDETTTVYRINWQKKSEIDPAWRVLQRSTAHAGAASQLQRQNRQAPAIGQRDQIRADGPCHHLRAGGERSARLAHTCQRAGVRQSIRAHRCFQLRHLGVCRQPK